MQIASEFLRQFIRDEAEYEVFGTSRRGSVILDRCKVPIFFSLLPKPFPRSLSRFDTHLMRWPPVT